MLATATGNCDVTNLSYNQNKYCRHVNCLSRVLDVTGLICADASDYVRSLLCATLLAGSVAVQC